MTGTRQKLPLTAAPSFYMKKSSLERGLDILERTQFYQAEQFSSNIYTGYWMLYIYDLKTSNTLFCRHGTGQWTLLNNDDLTNHERVGLYVPSYKLIEWKIAAGYHNWTAYYCDLPPPAHLSNSPCVFSLDNKLLPTSYSGLMDLLESVSPIKPLCSNAQKEGHQHPSLLKLTSSLHANYKEQVSIHDVIKDASIPASTAHYIFQKHLGLTPIQYRNKLRIFEALRLIGNNMMSITDACYGSGFNDYSRFYTHFTDELKISPRAFARFTSNIIGTQEQVV